jgi:uncharacterized protein YegP (UPF0339 family)
MRFEVYKSRNMRGTPPLSIRPQRWRFRIVADNNRILAYSEAYTNMMDAIDACRSIIGEAKAYAASGISPRIITKGDDGSATFWDEA